jgi:phosphoserine phosphatase RsbU/P
MYLIQTPLTANDVLRAYHHDEPLLFLGAAFISVGFVAAAFCLIRRRFDPLLIFLAMFANLYGQRLRLESDVLAISVVHSAFFFRLRAAVNYLVPIPAFAFFEAAGYLGRWGKTIVVVASVLFLGLVVGTFVFGPLPAFDLVNSMLVIVAIPAVALRSYLQRKRDQDYAVLQIGLLCFVVPAVWDNVVDALWHHITTDVLWHGSRVEPFGFAIFLASLGYVSARRLLQRDHELSEMRSEMELARRIQLSILPASFPESGAFRVAARYVPMTSVAGDFYDFLGVEASRAGILIADVSGHGVPAALIASMVKMAATAQQACADEPAKLLAGMNSSLCGNTQSQFVTAAYVHLDAEAREFRYAAAGHPPMLLLRNGQVTEVIENGLVLAVLEQATFSQVTHTLEPGDRLLLYTDGILEAANAQREFFGDANLHSVLRATASLSPTEAANSIIEAVEAWARTQDDDLTVLVCDFPGSARRPPLAH